MPVASVPKLCARCLIAKPRYAFRKSTHNLDGLHSWCAACVSEDSRARYEVKSDSIKARNRRHRQMCRELNAQLKRARGGCEALAVGLPTCDFEHLELLQWHHTDRASKLANPGELVQRAAAQKLRDEVRKCVALCPNCHARIEQLERERAA